MGQFSVEKPVAPGSVLSGNQHTGVRLLAGPMRPITNSYRATVKAWGTEGAKLFNTGVMQDGADAACAEAAQDVVQARAIIARDR